MKKNCFILFFALSILRGPQVSAQVCDSVNFTVNYVACDTNPAPLSITYPNTGGITYTFSLDGVPSANNYWNRVRRGNHTISYTGSNGCVSRSYTRNLAPNIPNYGYEYLSVCNQPATLYVRLFDSASRAFTFALNEVASATNSWENVRPDLSNPYRLSYSNNSGCQGMNMVRLTSSSLYVSLERQPLRTCSDTFQTFKLKVWGGRAPYVFKIDNGAETTDSIVYLREGTHNINVRDATGCQNDSYNSRQTAYYFRDSVSNRNVFVPNMRCGDTLGTMTISVTDSRVARPFTISLAGRPFTSDTVFSNVSTRYGYLPFTVKSAQGCLYYGYSDFYNANSLQVFTRDSCANRVGRGSIIASAAGGALPYSIAWSNGNLGERLNDVRIGTYKVFVTDANGCQVEKEQTLTTCVWSGDTDTSGVVNAADLMNIGLAFGERGQQRLRCEIDTSTEGSAYCTNWQPLNVPFWSKQTASGVNLKHVDASGNGWINHADTLAITRNWNKTRSLRSDRSQAEVRAAAPPIYVQTGRVAEGQWAAFPIMLGDATNAAVGIYGLAFSINYDPSVIDASSVYLSYGQNWLGSGDNILRISKNFDGTIETAISRINQQNGAGNGQIATLNFRTKTGMSGKNLVFNIDNQQVINKDAQVVPTVATRTSTTVLTSTSEADWANQIAVYPNPTTGNVHVEGQNLVIKSVEVFDIFGKNILISENIGQGRPLSIEHAGTYFLKILTDKGVLMRKIVKL